MVLKYTFFRDEAHFIVQAIPRKKLQKVSLNLYTILFIKKVFTLMALYLVMLLRDDELCKVKERPAEHCDTNDG